MSVPMKPLLLALLLSLSADRSWGTEGKPRFVSPDGRFAVIFDEVEGQETAIRLIDAKSGAVVLDLDSKGNPYVKQEALLWAPDGQRAALFSPDRRGGSARVFVRKGESFVEAELPELISPRIKSRKGAKTVAAGEEPVRWARANVLLVDVSLEDDDGKSGVVRNVITFDAKDRIKVSREKK